MCTVLLPPGGYQIAVNKYIISYINNLLNRRKSVTYHITYKICFINKSYAIHKYVPVSDDFTDFEFMFFLSCTIYNQFAAINQQNA